MLLSREESSGRHPHVTFWVAVVLGVYAATRLLALLYATFFTGMDDAFYLCRQIIYTYAWGTTAFFLLSYSQEMDAIAATGIKQLYENMERSALVAELACFLTAVALIVNRLLQASVDTLAVFDLSMLMELGAWIAVGVFFAYFRRRHQAAREQGEMDQLAEEQRQDAEFEQMIDALKK